MENKTDYYRMAAGFYLYNDLPDNYLELDDEELYKFLEENAWQPFEYYEGSHIAQLIEQLEYTLQRIEKDTRKNTLDDVREKLNIK